MRKFFLVVFIAAFAVGVASCRVINTLTGNDQNLNKVGDLWNDVPRMDGLASSEAEMPIYVRLIMRSAPNNLNRLSNQNTGGTPSTGDWAVFTTSKTPQDVQNFYTNERMTSFGKWDVSKNSTCLNGSEYRFSGVACVFSKTVNKRGIGLLIVSAQDEKKKQTNIFFIRVETDDTPQK